MHHADPETVIRAGEALPEGFKLFRDAYSKHSEVAKAFTGLSPKTLDKLSPSKQPEKWSFVEGGK